MRHYFLKLALSLHTALAPLSAPVHHQEAPWLQLLIRLTLTCFVQLLQPLICWKWVSPRHYLFWFISTQYSPFYDINRADNTRNRWKIRDLKHRHLIRIEAVFGLFVLIAFVRGEKRRQFRWPALSIRCDLKANGVEQCWSFYFLLFSYQSKLKNSKSNRAAKAPRLH